MFSRLGRFLCSPILPINGGPHFIHTKSSQSLFGSILYIQHKRFYYHPNQVVDRTPIVPANTLPVTSTPEQANQWANTVDWANKSNQRAYLDWLFKQFSYSKLEDWYGIKIPDFSTTKGGQQLLKLYSHPSIALNKVYPEHDWENWKFVHQADTFWTSVFNRKDYCKWLKQQLGLKKYEDWYEITMPQFVANHGEGLMKLYRGSVPSAVRGMHDVMPEWHNWRFKDLPRDYWHKKTNQREYLRWLGKHLGYSKTEDLYSVTAKDIMDNHGKGLLDEFKGSAVDAIMSVYDNLNLDKSKFVAADSNNPKK